MDAYIVDAVRTARGKGNESGALAGLKPTYLLAQTLRALLSAVPVDHVNTMGIPADDPYAQQGEPPVWAEYRAVIAEAGASVALEPILKWDFYKAVESPDHVLTIQTGDQALWGNVLLTMGCRQASTPKQSAK